MILGGAQENTLLTLQGLKRDTSWEVHLAYGPEIGSEGSLVEACRDLGVVLYPLKYLRRNLHPWYDCFAYQELLKYFATEKFDLVHTHSSKAGVLGRMAARKARVPHIVHTIHGLAFDEFQPFWKNWLYVNAERIAAKHRDVTIAVCQTMADRAVKDGIKSKLPIRTIYSGFPLNDFLEVKPCLPKQRFVIGMIARMFELKGHEDLMKLAPTLMREWDDIDFLIVGDGPLRRDWERWLSVNSEWKNRFEFVGRIQPQQIPSQIERMDMLLHLSWREGLARTIPQALAAGRPVCVYDVGGASEIVKDGKTGWIVPVGNLGKVMEATRIIKTNQDLARKTAKRGREYVRQLFAIERMQQEILRLYQELTL